VWDRGQCPARKRSLRSTRNTVRRKGAAQITLQRNSRQEKGPFRSLLEPPWWLSPSPARGWRGYCDAIFFEVIQRVPLLYLLRKNCCQNVGCQPTMREGCIWLSRQKYLGACHDHGEGSGASASGRRKTPAYSDIGFVGGNMRCPGRGELSAGTQLIEASRVTSTEQRQTPNQHFTEVPNQSRKHVWRCGTFEPMAITSSCFYHGRIYLTVCLIGS
jgi:hypothetical protein